MYPDLHCESLDSCLPVHLLCDGKVDCPDESDEGHLCGELPTLNSHAFAAMFTTNSGDSVIPFSRGENNR